MKAQMKQNYESPKMAIIEIEPQGVLCTSMPSSKGAGGITIQDVTSDIIAFP